jgi:excisionase family DNA binding protein
MENLFNPNDLISQVEAAEIRGVTRASINELVKRGRLQSIAVGGKVLLYRIEVENFEPDKGGRPAKAKPEASPATATNGTRKGATTKTTAKKGNRK